MQSNPTPGGAVFRYWRVHFTSDPYNHWVYIDCEEPVSEKRAVTIAMRLYPESGSVSAAVCVP